MYPENGKSYRKHGYNDFYNVDIRLNIMSSGWKI